MQKCSLTTSPNNKEVSVITGDLLSGLPPAVMPNTKGNGRHAPVTALHAGEFRNKVYTKEAAYCSNTVHHTSYHSIAQIIKKVVLKLIH